MQMQRGTVADGSGGLVIPSYGPFDRVSLGLQLREWGAEFPSILLLACAKVSLDTFEQLVKSSGLVRELMLGSEEQEVLTSDAATSHLIQAFLQRYVKVLGGTCSGTGTGDVFATIAAREEALLTSLLRQSIVTGTEKGGLVLDVVSALGLEEEWRRPLLLSGKELKQEILPRIPNGPIFTQVSVLCISMYDMRLRA